MADVNLTVSAELGDLRRQLESIPGITAEQARLMVAELDRGYKRAEKAAASAAKATRASMKQAEEATRKAAEASKDLGDKFGSVGSGAGKLAGALDMIAPGLGSVGQGIADLADVGEVHRAFDGGQVEIGTRITVRTRSRPSCGPSATSATSAACISR